MKIKKGNKLAETISLSQTVKIIKVKIPLRITIFNTNKKKNYESYFKIEFNN